MIGGRRAARFRNVVRSPADAVLFVRMLGWAAALPLLKRRLPLPRLVEAALPHTRPDAEPSAQTVIALARWVYRIPGFRDNCLEKSVLTYRYLPADGGQYRLVLGVRGSEADGPPGHAWLTIDGIPVHDSPESLADLVPIVAFDSGGRREELASVEPAAAGAGDGDESRAKAEEEGDRPPRSR
ncbi:MAG: lasso peptide biosynthesis B2 protein [Gaiellaceae bacterium]